MGSDIWRSIATLSVAAKVAPRNFDADAAAASATDELTVKVQTHMLAVLRAHPRPMSNSKKPD